MASSLDEAICFVLTRWHGKALLRLRRSRRRRRLLWRLWPTHQSGIAVAKTRGLSERTAARIAVARLSIQGLACQLQCRLVRRQYQPPAVCGGIVDKLPLVVFVFVIELANRLVLAEAGYAHDRTTAEYLIVSLTARTALRRTRVLRGASATLRRIRAGRGSRAASTRCASV